jgi:hypothetical protein
VAVVVVVVVVVAVVEGEEGEVEVVLPPLPRCHPPAQLSHLRSHPNLTPQTVLRIRHYHHRRR